MGVGSAGDARGDRVADLGGPPRPGAALGEVGHDGVLDSPAPQAWVTAFSESSIDFDVRFWHASDIATTFRVRSDVAMSLKAAFDREGIEIPFPQRVVTMVADDREPQA